MRNRTEKLPKCAVLRHTPAVSAGMYHKDTQAFKRYFPFPQKLKHRKCRPSGTDPYTPFIRYHLKPCLLRQIFFPCLDLQPEALRLMLVRCSEYHIIPYRESRDLKAPLIITPRVLI